MVRWRSCLRIACFLNSRVLIYYLKVGYMKGCLALFVRIKKAMLGVNYLHAVCGNILRNGRKLAMKEIKENFPLQLLVHFPTMSLSVRPLAIKMKNSSLLQKKRTDEENRLDKWDIQTMGSAHQCTYIYIYHLPLYPTDPWIISSAYIFHVPRRVEKKEETPSPAARPTTRPMYPFMLCVCAHGFFYLSLGDLSPGLVGHKILPHQPAMGQ